MMCQIDKATAARVERGSVATFRAIAQNGHVNRADVAAFEQDLLAAIPPQCLGTSRGVLWHRCADSGSLEAEPFVTLKKSVPQRTGYERSLLPDATLACAYSTLDDENAERTYAAIRRWMRARGYRLAGPKREIFLGEMLEIQFPLFQHSSRNSL